MDVIPPSRQLRDIDGDGRCQLPKGDFAAPLAAVSGGNSCSSSCVSAWCSEATTPEAKVLFGTRALFAAQGGLL